MLCHSLQTTYYSVSLLAMNLLKCEQKNVDVIHNANYCIFALAKAEQH